MNPIKNTIEINGKIYDASSGKHVGPVKDKHESPHKETKHTHSSTVKTKPSPIRPNEQKTTLNRRPDKSTTLMRPAVKKPTVKHPEGKIKAKKQIRLGGPHQERIKRAEKIGKSSQISKFNLSAVSSLSSKKVPVRVEKLEVKPSPPREKQAPKSADNDWPVVDQFEKALQNASSHLEEFIDEAATSKKGRRLAYAAISLVAVVAIGFGGYQAIPAIKVKMAGDKAGFSASFPDYSPSGFGMSASDATPGLVTLSYKSRTDDKGFKITQSPSEWNDQSLVNNFLATGNKDYETIQFDGKTIYTYDKFNATWVDGGIWFKVESNADLTNEQMLGIAKGL